MISLLSYYGSHWGGCSFLIDFERIGIMNENNKEKPAEPKFEPPKMPYMQLMTVFAIPSLMVIIPAIISNAESLTNLIIIALITLSALLFVLWFTTHMQIYSESYKRQVFEFRIEMFKDEVAELKKEAAGLKAKLNTIDKSELR